MSDERQKRLRDLSKAYRAIAKAYRTARFTLIEALSTQQQRVYYHVEAHPFPMRSADIAEYFSISQSAASEVLRDLCEFGLLEREITETGGYSYKVKP